MLDIETLTVILTGLCVLRELAGLLKDTIALWKQRHIKDNEGGEAFRSATRGIASANAKTPGSEDAPKAGAAGVGRFRGCSASGCTPSRPSPVISS